MIPQDYKHPEAPPKKEYEPLPAEIYQAELEDLELELGSKYKSDEQEEKYKFIFTVLDEGPYYGRKIWYRATKNLSTFKGGSNLYKILSKLAEHDFTEDECKRQHEVLVPDLLNSFVGKQLRLVITQVDKADKSGKTNKVESFMPIKEELPKFDPDKVPKKE